MRMARSQGYFLAGPLILFGFLAFHSKSVDSFQVPCGTSSKDAEAMAYAPIMRQGRLLFSHSIYKVERRSLLSLARLWDGKVKAGVLVPLTPVSLEDSPQEGERGAIMRMKSQVVSQLLSDAKRLAQNGKVDSATGEVLMAARLSESLKYSDFCSIYQAGLEERSESNFLATHWDRMSPATQAASRSEMALVVQKGTSLKSLTKLARDDFYDWKQRMASPCTLEGVRRTLNVCKTVQEDPTSRSSIKAIQVGAGDDSEVSYLYEFRLAWRSERQTESAMSKMLGSTAPSIN
jgi:hypothetical protein